MRSRLPRIALTIIMLLTAGSAAIGGPAPASASDHLEAGIIPLEVRPSTVDVYAFVGGSGPAVSFLGVPIDPQATGNAALILDLFDDIDEQPNVPVTGQIRVNALNMVATQPIIANLTGVDEEWDVRIIQSPSQKSTGTLEVVQTSDEGGFFIISLRLFLDMVFTRTSDGLEQTVPAPELEVEGSAEFAFDCPQIVPAPGAAERFCPGVNANTGVLNPFTVGDFSTFPSPAILTLLFASAPQPANTPPVLNDISDVTLNEGQVRTVPVAANDTNGDDLVYTITGMPGFSSFTDFADGTGVFGFQPGFDDAGVYTVTVRVSEVDDPDQFDEDTFTITVTNVNRPPVLDEVSDPSVVEGQSRVITINATDPDGDDVAFTIQNAPSYSQFVDNGDGTATFTVTPPLGSSPDVFNVTVTATDNGSPPLSDQETFTLGITPGSGNSPPVLEPVGDQTAREFESTLISDLVVATDANADTITLTAVGLPSGCDLVQTVSNPGLARADLQCDPDVVAGTYAVTVTATDDDSPPFQLTDTLTFTLTIVPFLDAGDDQTVELGQPAVFAPDASAGATIDFDLDNDGEYETPGPTVVVIFDDLGVYPVGVRATKNGAVSTDEVTVTVTPPNQPPVFDPIDDQTVNEGQTVAAPITASDPEGDAVEISLVQGPSFIQIVDDGDGNATMTISPTHDDAGDYLVALRVAQVADALVQFTDVFINVTVNNVNRNPTVAPIDDLIVNEGETGTLTVNASDPDGDDLAFTADLPAFCLLNDNGDGSADIQCNPDEGDAGDHNGVVTVTDDGDPALIDSSTIVVRVTNVNHAPIIDSVSGQTTLNEGGTTIITVMASDPDGDNLTMTLEDNPSFCTIVDNGNGAATITCNPGFNDSGTHTFRVFAQDDGSGAIATGVLITIVVNNVNRPPVLDDIDDQQVAEDGELFGTFTATDPDGDPITFSASGLPGFCTLTDNGDGTASLVCNPGDGNAGTYPITIFASDGALQDAEQFVITVSEPNQAPLLNPINDVSVNEGETTTITISSSDPDGDSLTLSADLPGFAELTDNGDGTGTITLSPGPGDAGAYQISITASDDGDPVLSDTGSLILTVEPVEGPGEESYDELKTLVRSAVDNRIVERVLITVLDLAEFFDERGADGAARALLEAFIRLVERFTPFFIVPSSRLV